MDIDQIVKLKAAGLSVTDIVELKNAGLLKAGKGEVARKPSINGAPFEDVATIDGGIIKAPQVRMTREGEFIKFDAKGFKPRSVSIDDLKAGWDALQAGEIATVSKKTGVRFVVRKSSAEAGKEKVLGENLVILARNAGFC